MVEFNPCRLRCITGIQILVGIMVVLILAPLTFYHINKERPHKRQTFKRRSRDYVDISTFDYKLRNSYFPDEQEETLLQKSYKSSNRKGRVRRVRRFQGTNEYKNRTCVPLHTRKGDKPICIFDPKEDRMISSYINDRGTWEPDLISMTADILVENPKMTFIDLGCNLGAFTISMAALGNRVIAVDILPSALDNLQESLNRGGLQENVTLLLNALTNKRETLSVEVVSDNIGGSYIKEGNENNGNDVISVQSILVDDLLELINSGEVFIKMDIEGSEWKALEGAKEFFQKVNVKFLLMEWMLHKGNEDGEKLKQFLVSGGFIPYLKYNNSDMLDVWRSAFWPDNVLWAKR